MMKGKSPSGWMSRPRGGARVRHSEKPEVILSAQTEGFYPV